MYVVATCGVFVVGVKCDICTTNCTAVDTLNSIKKEFIPYCQKRFCNLSRNEVEGHIKVVYACDDDPIVTALSFMDKFTDAAYNVVRKEMITALKGSIIDVYTKVYEREMQCKVETLRTQLLF